MPRTYAEAKGRAGSMPARTPTWKGGTLMKLESFGIPELDDLWKKLTQDQQRNIEVAAWRKASKPMLAAIKGNATSMVGRVTGNLYKSIGSSPVRGRAILELGIRRFHPWTGYHGHLINDGTMERMTDAGERRGAVEGTKFFDLAYQATKDQIIDDYREGRIEAFHKMVQRANAKAKSKRRL